MARYPGCRGPPRASRSCRGRRCTPRAQWPDVAPVEANVRGERLLREAAPHAQRTHRRAEGDRDRPSLACHDSDLDEAQRVEALQGARLANRAAAENHDAHRRDARDGGFVYALPPGPTKSANQLISRPRWTPATWRITRRPALAKVSPPFGVLGSCMGRLESFPCHGGGLFAQRRPQTLKWPEARPGRGRKKYLPVVHMRAQHHTGSLCISKKPAVYGRHVVRLLDVEAFVK